MSTLDALLGKLQDNGTDLELRGTTNFVGFEVTADGEGADARWTFTVAGGGLGRVNVLRSDGVAPAAFDTIALAVASLDGADFETLRVVTLLSPGTYDETITVPGTINTRIICLGHTAGTPRFTGSLGLGSHATITAITGVSGALIQLEGCVVNTLTPAGATVELTDSGVGTWVNDSARALLNRSYVFDDILCTELYAERSFIQGVALSGTIAELIGCRFEDPVTVEFTGSAGVLQLDAYSNFRWKASTQTLTNGTVSVIGDLTP